MAKKVKKLEFKCPECDCTKLECCEVNAYVTSIITDLDEDGDFNYGVPVIEDSQVDAFQCVECGFRPQDKNKIDICDNLELIKWLKKNMKKK